MERRDDRIKRQRVSSRNKTILDSDTDEDNHYESSISNTREETSGHGTATNPPSVTHMTFSNQLRYALGIKPVDVVSSPNTHGVLSESSSSNFDSEQEDSRSEEFEESEELEEEDDDEFVVSDGHVEFQDGTVAATSEVVEDSSSYFKKKLHVENEKDRFKIFIHYVLGCILDEDFQDSIECSPEKDEYFGPCVKYFYDKLLIIAKSTLQSGRWKDHFLENLNHLPLYKKKEISEAIMDRCQVCNKTHTSLALRVKFYGEKYFPEKFKLDLHDTKHKHPDPGFYSVSYVVGRHCFNRSSRYHAIIHYMTYLVDSLRKTIQKEKEKVFYPTNQDMLEKLVKEDDWMESFYQGFLTISTIYKDSQSPWFTDSWWGECF